MDTDTPSQQGCKDGFAGRLHTLCDHAAGNYRILTTMAAELLAVGAQRELPQLDEKLYLDVFAQPDSAPKRRVAPTR